MQRGTCYYHKSPGEQKRRLVVGRLTFNSFLNFYQKTTSNQKVTLYSDGHYLGLSQCFLSSSEYLGSLSDIPRFKNVSFYPVFRVLLGTFTVILRSSGSIQLPLRFNLISLRTDEFFETLEVSLYQPRSSETDVGCYYLGWKMVLLFALLFAFL